MQLAFLAVALKDDAARAKEVIADYVPTFGSYREYFDYADKLNLDCQAVSYEEDGSVVLRFEEA